MYTKQFEIRWSDLDPNRHLANAAYLNFMSHTRMGFLMEHGFGQQELVKHHLGPVVFYEHIYYFKEILSGKPITVTLALKGLSEDGMYFEFEHNLYSVDGEHMASCEMMGAWIDLGTRKLTYLPAKLLTNFESITKTEDFRVLTKEDTRKYGVRPQHIDPKKL